MRKLLIATRNRGKLAIFKRELKNFPFTIVGLDDVKTIPHDFEPEEKGTSFKENAVIKAKAYGKISGLLTLADDSGLEVEALGGRPGIYSSRYRLGTDEDRYRKLLKEMENIPNNKRAARFVCVIALYNPQTGSLFTYEGECQGKISRAPKGDHGFGYDPIFFIPQLGKTTAQLKPEEKTRISHRGQALRKLKKDVRILLRDRSFC